MCTYVRELTLREGKRLSSILKTARSAVYLRRAQVVAFSGQGMRVQEIAKRLHLHEEYVRELIRQFDRGGFDGLRPRKSSGRPSKYSPEEVSMMLEYAGTRPQDMGLPFTVWSLRKLSNHLIRSFQRTKTWKESNDPDFKAKKNASARSTKKSRSTRR